MVKPDNIFTVELVSLVAFKASPGRGDWSNSSTEDCHHLHHISLHTGVCARSKCLGVQRLAERHAVHTIGTQTHSVYYRRTGTHTRTHTHTHTHTLCIL